MSLFTKYEVVSDEEKWALKRTFLFGTSYLDFQTPRYWWGRTSGCFKCCWTDEAAARRELRRRTV